MVRHPNVETAILCDIDETVIKLSKKYLPGMSVGFLHLNVSVQIGDGFKFLADKKNEFDVIITDSSDPEGPAESLFQKPCVELLYGALREGSVMTTQGSSPSLTPHTSRLEKSTLVTHLRRYRLMLTAVSSLAESPWLHLELIKTLKKSCKEIFPTLEYAYATAPSGQIGFMVCCKDGLRDVKEPLRTWELKEEEELCRYYSQEIHRANFVLPVFARKALR